MCRTKQFFRWAPHTELLVPVFWTLCASRLHLLHWAAHCGPWPNVESINTLSLRLTTPLHTHAFNMNRQPNQDKTILSTTRYSVSLRCNFISLLIFEAGYLGLVSVSALRYSSWSCWKAEAPCKPGDESTSPEFLRFGLGRGDSNRACSVWVRLHHTRSTHIDASPFSTYQGHIPRFRASFSKDFPSAPKLETFHTE